MKTYFVFFLLVMLQAEANASPKPECMGFREDAWASLEISNLVMSRAQCQDTIELPEGLYLMRYELLGKPVENGGKTTCHWRWVPGNGGIFEPTGNAPETIVCSLSP